MGAARQIFKNGLAQVVGRLLKVADQLLLVPFFLTHWGAEYYGEWLTLTIIPNVLLLSDLGIGTAISNKFVLTYVGGDREGARRVMANGLALCLCCIGLGLLLTVGTLLGANALGLFDKAHIPAAEAVPAVAIVMATRLVSFFNITIWGFYTAANCASRGMNIDNATHALATVASVVVVLAGYRVYALAVVGLCVTLVTTVLNQYLAHLAIGIPFIRPRLDRGIALPLLRKGLAYFATPIWQMIYFQGTTLAIRLAAGPVAVALFNTLRTFASSIRLLYELLGASIFPEMQYEYGKGNENTARLILCSALTLSLVAAPVLGLFMLLLGRPFYSLWTGGTLSVDWLTWGLFVGSACLALPWWTVSTTYRVVDRPRHIAIVSLTAACCATAATYALALRLGVTGGALSAFLFDAAMCLATIPYGFRIFGVNSDFYRSSLGWMKDYLLGKVVARRSKKSC